MAAIFALSARSDVPDLPAGLGDHTGHFIGYAILAACALRGFAHARWGGVGFPAAWRAIGLASCYGLTDEFHQSLVPGRTSSIDDWLVDTAGAVTAVLIALRIAAARRRRRDV
jgi:VanZ family protein